VPALVDTLSNAHLPFARRKAALADLAALVADRPGYACEAVAAGVPAAAAALLASPSARVAAPGSAGAGALDEGVADLVSTVVAACGGEAAAPPSVRTLTFSTGDGSSPPSSSSASAHTVAVAQGSLADGIGARLWASAAAMGRALADPAACLPAAVGPPPAWGGAAVLELGAGVGLVGVLAARLASPDGARPACVDLTDGDEAALATLRRTLAANAGKEEGGEGEGEGGEGEGCEGEGGCWEVGRVAIRRLVWAAKGEEDPGALPGRRRPGCSGSLSGGGGEGGGGDGAGPTTPPTTASPPPPSLCPACAAAGPGPPSLPRSSRYGLVLAADCLYEPEGAVELAEELCARLDPSLPGGGVALLAGPVRDGGETLAAFAAGARARGAVVTVADAPSALVAAREAGDGVAGRPGEYDRFVFIRVVAPAAWAGVGGPRG